MLIIIKSIFLASCGNMGTQVAVISMKFLSLLKFIWEGNSADLFTGLGLLSKETERHSISTQVYPYSKRISRVIWSSGSLLN